MKNPQGEQNSTNRKKYTIDAVALAYHYSDPLSMVETLVDHTSREDWGREGHCRRCERYDKLIDTASPIRPVDKARPPGTIDPNWCQGCAYSFLDAPEQSGEELHGLREQAMERLRRVKLDLRAVEGKRRQATASGQAEEWRKLRHHVSERLKVAVSECRELGLSGRIRGF